MMQDLRQIVERGIGPGTFRTREFNPWEDFVERPSGLLIPGHIELSSRIARRPTGIDLFSGAGGFSLGLIQAGFEIAAALDSDPFAMFTYLTNLGDVKTKIVFIEPEDEKGWKSMIDRELKRREKAVKTAKNTKEKEYCEASYQELKNARWGYGWISHHCDTPAVRLAILGDARKVTGELILNLLGMKREEIDCVCGGPPCQGFTTVGKRNVMDPRNSLVLDFARLVVEIRPKTCVMENVPGILSMVTPEGLPVVDCVCKILSDGGMGPFEALKRSLVMSSGAGAIIRNSKDKKAVSVKEFSEKVKESKAKAPSGKQPEKITQPTLF